MLRRYNKILIYNGLKNKINFVLVYIKNYFYICLNQNNRNMKTLEFKNRNRQTVFDGLTDFLIKSKRDDNDLLVVNVNSFHNDLDGHWYAQVSYYDN
ncbi:hypothetical protein P2559Y_0003 [Croceibacter phage P2559Y]|uniref:hypothetical protein n=1 Tax=Croceibacter phage P2559Y TaxID=1327037 RepID=UPI0003F4AA42|nr:hypothetical protein P2559Y_0003 [Croceibacter phage P2559Y]AGM14066.1 hypothetical protein P2559Y_0003 [Croceibacter phage P2559Y]